MPSDLIQYLRMRHIYRLILLCAGPSLLLLNGCATGGRVTAGGPYHVTAYKPHDPSAVRVKVSLSQQNVYVMEYGFSVSGDRIVPSTGGGPGRYVGYPMGYWCEFAPAYGFHQGFIHPDPHTHGCIRLHGEAAAKFYALVRIGTPVNIAASQPEDATLGPKVQRVDDSHTPDPPGSVMISDAAFEKPSGPLLE